MFNNHSTSFEKFWSILTFILIILIVFLVGSAKGDPMVIQNDFFEAISFVESSHNPHAIGDNGKAYGIYQIRKAYLADGNRIAGTNYTLNDMLDPAKARVIMEAYIFHYGNIALRKKYPNGFTYEQAIEVLSRIHNGGPRGYMKSSTKKYWNRVSKACKNNN